MCWGGVLESPWGGAFVQGRPLRESSEVKAPQLPAALQPSTEHRGPTVNIFVHIRPSLICGKGVFHEPPGDVKCLLSQSKLSGYRARGWAMPLRHRKHDL